MTYSKNPFGVMQGRLLPKYRGRYQAHPVGYWQDEFARAAEFKLDCIEFILDFNDADSNPLLRQGGLEEIQRAGEKHGVRVLTVCADYFMEAPLHHPSPEIAANSALVLHRLLSGGEVLRLTDIVLPCVDQSSLANDPAAQDRFVRCLAPFVDLAERVNINIALETDLAPQPFVALLERIGSRRVTVNYDTGNSAALGFDPAEEMACYGDRISDIHIKDRVLGGRSTTLGTGDAQFDRFFEALHPVKYTGPFIMQAYRDDEGLAVFRNQSDWIRSHYLETMS